MVKALIIDDERLARVELRRLLSAHPDVEIVGEAGSGERALGLIAETLPDVMFLDIQMPGMTGFDLLERVETDIPQTIFTTAFDQHAIRAFEVNALDYLLKPIAPDRLAAAVSRISTRHPGRRVSQVFVREGERCWVVSLPDIRLLESEGNYARVYFGSEHPLIRRSLNALEQQLDKSMFFRANRRQILNLVCIERTSIGATGCLTAVLRGGIQVELSRRRSDRFRALFSL
jgi:two-component system LytT family response regulator